MFAMSRSALVVSLYTSENIPCYHGFRLVLFMLLALAIQVGPDMLISGFLQPIPDLTPVIPSIEETYAIDPTVTQYESKIIFFYKAWDLFGALSNFSPHPIQMPDENGDYSTWLSVEHYYQVSHFSNIISIFPI